MLKQFFILTLLFLILQFSSTKVSYNGHSVILIRIDNKEEFSKFQKQFPESSIDLWSEQYGVAVDMEIRFSPSQLATLKNDFFSKKQFIKFSKFEIRIKDLGQLLKAEEQQMISYNQDLAKKMKKLKTQKERDQFRFKKENWFQSYHTYEEIVEYIDNLVKSYPTMVDKEVIGKSVEGRDIVVLRIHSPGKYNSNKPSLFFESLQHAREWVSGPTGQYAALQLLSTYNTDERVKKVLDSMNFHYVPILNPDGFRFTHTSTRMWRKNRRRNAGGSFGVDLNRNWNSGWGGPGSSGSPRSDTYRGTAAFSEPETKAIDDYFKRFKSQLKAAIDIHSFSQLNLRPWGKLRTVSPDEALLNSIGQKMMDALKAVHRVTYRNIRAAQLYQASGLASDDWYENYGLLAYTFELRPSSSWGGGFALPARQILPCAEENFPAILVLAEHVINNKNTSTFKKEIDSVVDLN